jgi:hypothetical protein
MLGESQTLDEFQTLAELSRSSESDHAKVASEFVAMYERQYGALEGPGTAERQWKRLIDAWVGGGDSMKAAQIRGIQDMRQMVGIAEPTKRGLWKRILGIG